MNDFDEAQSAPEEHKVFALIIGKSRHSTKWDQKMYTWEVLKDRLSKFTELEVSAEEYHTNEEVRADSKDVGGYVPGISVDGTREIRSLKNKQILTLDIDDVSEHENVWERVIKAFPGTAIISHSSCSHLPTKPKFRVVMPLDRPVSPPEYEKIVKMASIQTGLMNVDDCSQRYNQIMYWPAHPKGVDPIFNSVDGRPLRAEEMLKKAEEMGIMSSVELSDIEDPTTKDSLIGDFCRAYDVYSAIEKFIPEVYTQVGMSRFFYNKSSSHVAGAIVYQNGTFLYSHHGSDPLHGQTVNSFDMVRIHLYGAKDKKVTNRTKETNKPSFKAMVEMCTKDSLVKEQWAIRKTADMLEDFGEYTEEEKEEVRKATVKVNTHLKRNEEGEVDVITENFYRIMIGDSKLKGRLSRNVFDDVLYVMKPFDWTIGKTPAAIRETDLSVMRSYIESKYGLYKQEKFRDAIDQLKVHHYHNPIKDYISGIKWDGKERVDTLLTDYFNTPDNVYTRESIRKMLVAAVARVFDPGVKYDLVLTLVGPQGCGKSTFLSILGGDWFMDDIGSVDSKDAKQSLKGTWIVEWAELAGLRKADLENVKRFITATEDRFRPAYGRTVEVNKRQCVFFATTNDDSFLTDTTGNRRFLPVKVSQGSSKNVWTDLRKERDQIWAEAYELYCFGEELVLSKEALDIASGEQKEHMVDNSDIGIVEAYLERKIPKGWNDKTPREAKINFYRMSDFMEETKEDDLVQRSKVCAREIWHEALSNDKNPSIYDTKRINQILGSLEGWQKRTIKSYGYGVQRGYVKI